MTGKFLLALSAPAGVALGYFLCVWADRIGHRQEHRRCRAGPAVTRLRRDGMRYEWPCGRWVEVWGVQPDAAGLRRRHDDHWMHAR